MYLFQFLKEGTVIINNLPVEYYELLVDNLLDHCERIKLIYMKTINWKIQCECDIALLFLYLIQNSILIDFG